MIKNIFKGLITGILGFMAGIFLFLVGVYVWYKLSNTHRVSRRVDDCNEAASLGIQVLSEQVRDSWFERKHHDVIVYSDGACLFYKFYPNAGALYFGQEEASGHILGVAITADELHEMANSIPPETDFEQMLDLLSERAKKQPVPVHSFE